VFTDPTKHGHSVASWTGATIVLVGAVVAAIGLPLALPWLFWTGLGLMAVGGITAFVLSKLGFGVPLAYRGEGDVEARDHVFGSDGAARTHSR
jgi:hypothetical protein